MLGSEKIWYCRSTLYTFAQYVFHQNDRVILLSYRQFIISANVNRMLYDIENNLLADTIIF